MDITTARSHIVDWVIANRSNWRGLRAAHLVGSVAGMRPEDPLPAHKDVDLHLIFDAGSQMLQAKGPFPNLLEEEYRGLLLEAGLKQIDAYATPEAVLANPEVAHHLTLDCILFDPDGVLVSLQPHVRSEYSKRRWVRARLDAERNSLASAMSLRPMASEMLGPSGEINLLGYSTTFVAAAMHLARLEAPSTGSHALSLLHKALDDLGRPELYDALLDLLGVADFSVSRVKALLPQAGEAFDIATRVRQSSHPFQHKLHSHLRPYFVQSCEVLLDEGLHRECLAWLLPFYLSSCDVILVDGPAADRPRFAKMQADLIVELGLADGTAREAAFERLAAFQDGCFALAEQSIVSSPLIQD